MEYQSSISSSNFLETNFFTKDDAITEYIELPTKSSFNRLYKIKRFGQWFVLKALKPEFISQSLYVSLLKKEFDLAVQLDHPYIVKTISKEDNKRVGPAIMMEYIDGMTLKEYLETKPSKRSRIRVVYQILDAMKYYHSKQIIHRDLKPSNILITHNGFNVKIIDFGLADADSYDIFKQPAGTRKYAAPEQLESGRSIDARTDIYSFGKLLKLIFPIGYNHIINKCIQQNPKKRYQNVNEIIRAFNTQKKVFISFYIGLLLMLFFSPTVMLLYQNMQHVEKEESEEQIISSSLAELDSIYAPIIKKIKKGEYIYKEIALANVLSTYDSVTIIREIYEDKLKDNTEMYSLFMNLYQIKWGKILQDINTIYVDKMPSYIDEYSEGNISEDEYNIINDEFSRLIKKNN